MILADVSSVGKDSKTGDSYRNGNVMYEVGSSQNVIVTTTESA